MIPAMAEGAQHLFQANGYSTLVASPLPRHGFTEAAEGGANSDTVRGDTADQGATILQNCAHALVVHLSLQDASVFWRSPTGLRNVAYR